MSRVVSYHPKALEELACRAIELDSFKAGLGVRLLAMVAHKLNLAATFPESQPVFYRHLRTVLARP